MAQGNAESFGNPCKRWGTNSGANTQQFIAKDTQWNFKKQLEAHDFLSQRNISLNNFVRILIKYMK